MLTQYASRCGGPLWAGSPLWDRVWSPVTQVADGTGLERRVCGALDWYLTPRAYPAVNDLEAKPMRILSVVLSFVVAMSLAGAGLSYLVTRIGEQRIQVQ